MNAPNHIAIILDGNRRFGEVILGNPLEGHRQGIEKLKEVIEWVYDLGVKAFTVWGFSTENFGRTEEEIDMFMGLLEDSLRDMLANEAIHKRKVRVTVMGRIDLFPQKIQSLLLQVIDATKNYSECQFNLALGYGSEQEFIDATKKIAQQVLDGKLSPDKIDAKVFCNNLYMFDLPKIDLIIRTGGAIRTSGFTPLQGAYAEWWFTEKLWPEIQREDIVKAIVDYSERKRRFGK